MTNIIRAFRDYANAHETATCLEFKLSQNEAVKVKVKFTLEQATKAQRGNKGVALLLL
jgi:hypothetical protein